MTGGTPVLLKSVLLAVGLLTATTLSAQDKGLDHVGPWIGSDAVGAARIDLTKVQPKQIFEQLQKALSLPEAETARPREEIVTLHQTITDAGFDQAFVVFSLSIETGVPTIVLPRTERSKPDALARQPQRLPMFTIKTFDHVVVLGDAKAIAQLPAGPPGPIIDRLRALTGSPIAVVIEPPAVLRQIFEELNPKLPTELGGGPTTGLTRDFTAAIVSFDATLAKPTLQLIAPDPAAAGRLHGVVEKGRAWLSGPGAEHLTKIGVDAQKLVGALPTKVDGATITLSADLQQLTPALSKMSEQVRASAKASQHMNDLKQIALALHNYHDTYRSFPPLYSVDKAGKPLLSWRVLILPYLDQQALYKQFKLDEPWDSPHNSELAKTLPKVYIGPTGDAVAGKTSYVLPTGAGIFGQPKGVGIRQITDGTSNTIMTVAAAKEHTVLWTKPDDMLIDKANPGSKFAITVDDKYLVGFADGSVFRFPKTIAPDELYKFFTIGGGEVVNRP